MRLIFFIKELGKKFNKDSIGAISENKRKYNSFNVKINVKLERVTNKNNKKYARIFS